MSKRVFGLGLLFSLAILLFCSNKASAYSISDSDSVMQKIIYTQALECYDSEEPALGLSTSLDGFHGMISNLQGGDSGATNRKLLYYGNDPIWCNDLLTNKTANRFSSVEINDLSEKEKILEGMGYSKVSSTDDNSNTATKKCAAIGYHTKSKTEDKDKWTETICAERKDGRWLVTIDESGDSNAGKEISISYNTQPGQLQFQYRRPQNLVEWWSCPWCAHYETKKITIDDNLSNASSVFAHIANEIALEIGADGVSNHGDYDEFGEYWALCSKPVGTLDDSKVNCVDDSAHSIYLTSSGSSGDEYERVSASSYADKDYLVKKLSNGRWNYGYLVTGLRFSDMEKYNLYSSYLKDVYGVSSVHCYPSGGHDGVGNYYVRLWWPEEGKYSDYCYITVDDNNAGKMVTGLYDNMFFGKGDMKLTTIIEQLNALDLGDTPPTSIIDDNSENSSSSGEGGSVFDDCYNAGIESQSWIICPVVRNMTESIVGMDGMIDSWLSIDANDFKANGGTQNAWGIFRNVANTAMIIMFLIIIFSQLTGYGIDNYGIKKMLPKLILMAILINLSFIICELAVDLSNIMGSGVQSLLRDIGEQINNGGDGKSIWDVVIKLLGAAAGTGAGAGVVISTVSSAAGAGPMIIVSILIMLLIALVAVLIFFLMLGARLVVVVFFTMISPLAFACYVLPNTQGLFKRWWNIFKGALVVYPICGALYGLSYLIRGALSDSNDIPMLLVAAVSPYLPFLALPVLLKGTLSALGVVGNAITTLGSGLRKGLSAGSSTWNRTMQGTEAYKNRMNDVSWRRQEQNAQRFIDRMKRRRDRGLEVSENDLRREASAEKLLARHRSDYEEARTTLAKRNAQDMTADDLKNEFINAFNNNDGSEEAQARLIAATNAWHERSGSAIFNDLAEHVGAIDIQGSKSAQHSLMAMQRLMSTNSRFANDAMNKSGDLGEMFSNAGIKGRGADGKLTFKNLSDYTKDHHTMTQDKDWATQSAATLQRAIKSGALSISDATRLLNSNDPTIVSGLQSDQNKRDTLQSFVNGFDWANYDLKSDTNAVGQKLFNQSANQYRSAIEESKRQAVEHAQNMEDRRVEALEENVRQMQALNESLRHGGNSSTSSQSGDQINPTDGQIL